MSKQELSKEEREINVYGITEDRLQSIIQINAMCGSNDLMLAAGMLSNCQEVLEYLEGDVSERELIRKSLNQAKYIIFEYMDKHNVR
jgi:hypothetical protein